VRRFFSSGLERTQNKIYKCFYKIIIIIIIKPLLEKEGELEELGDDVHQRFTEKKRKTTREGR
jgi:hypothetical protein